MYFRVINESSPSNRCMYITGILLERVVQCISVLSMNVLPQIVVGITGILPERVVQCFSVLPMHFLPQIVDSCGRCVFTHGEV